MPKTKREIDKEIMFQKIMPTSLRTAEPESTASPVEIPAQPQIVAKPAPEPVKPSRPPTLINDSGVQFREKTSVVLVNLMEYMVVEKLDAAFDKFKCCKCDKCRKDVAAIALNKLSPKYVVTDPDKISARTEAESGSEVYTAIVQGILHVRTHPRH